MIRVLLPRFHYKDQRVLLVEKFLRLTPVKRKNLKRCYPIFEKLDTEVPCLEGFLENKDKLTAVGRRLTDEPHYVTQDDPDMPTYLVDDGEMAYEIGGG